MGQASYDFESSTVVVTGGSSGIGRQIALGFGDAGAHVVVADIEVTPRDQSQDEPTHELIRSSGGSSTFREVDVSREADVRALIEETAASAGGVDVMVNNAGVYLNRSILDVSADDLERVFAVNLQGAFFGCKHAARDMIDREAKGAIINVASISAEFSHVGQSVYEMTKGGIKMLTRNAALEFATAGIRVNAVAPGKIATSFGPTDERETKQVVRDQQTTKPVPMQRAGEPADVVQPVLFLASEGAAYVTGEMVFVDGGYQIL